MAPQTRSQISREAMATVRPTSQYETANEQRSHVRLRQPDSGSGSTKNHASSTGRSKPDEPPRFVIDLSLPPERRYIEVCTYFMDQMRGLTSLFDEVVGRFARFVPLLWLHRICWLLLRRVYDEEENRELKGISKATNMPMYLLICFNVLLDLFMGCTSGGAAVTNGNGGFKMVHFRTLDWGMEPLRRIVVQLDFKTEAEGPIIASSITYAGYVGVLTGVRKGFSLSLNFRPDRHDKGSFWHDLRYNWHLFMVLLGRRRSISSQLRCFLLPSPTSAQKAVWRQSSDNWQYWRYVDVIKQVRGEGCRPLTSTACYLCFSDGKETTVLEKDRITAVARSSDDFAVVTNNDLNAEDEKVVEESPAQESAFVAALAEIVNEAKDRRQCAEHNYHNMRAKKAKDAGIAKGTDLKSVLDIDDIIGMVQRYPTLNETSHYACVMDAAEGRMSWCRRWWKPITAKWIRAHQSDTW